MLFNQTLKAINKGQERKASGKVNCIPWGLPRFEEAHPGIEQGRYFIVTANSKIGKTQLTDYLFVYNVIDFVRKRTDMDARIYYFTLEMSPQEKMLQAMSNRLYKKFGLKYSPRSLRSVRYELPTSVSDAIKKDKEYYDYFSDRVHFIDDIRNYTGIEIFLKEELKKLGKEKRQTIHTGNGNINKFVQYVPNNPEEYVIVILDHASLLTVERGQGNIKKAVDDVSHMFVELRNKYNIIPVLVQQQAAQQESVQNLKFGKLRPSLDGLGESKATGRDANTVFGLFAPVRHELDSYFKYDVSILRDRLRFLEILASRDGGAGTISPLLFYGECSAFTELPKPDDPALQDIYNKFR